MKNPQIIIEGEFNEDFVRSALLEIYLKDEMPGSVEYIVFLDNASNFEKIIKYIPVEARKKIKSVYSSDPTSLSITYKHFDIIIISVTSKEEQYLKTNRKALSGLLMHELMHLKQRRHGLDTKIERDGKKEIRKIASKVITLDYPKKEVEDAFFEVFEACSYMLKEIYDNLEIVRKGEGSFILEDYSNLYKKKTTPFFFDSIGKIKAKKDIETLKKAFIYETNLMSVVIPFTLLAKKGSIPAKKFIQHIRNYYESSIFEIAGNFTEIIEYAINHFSWAPSYRRKIFNLVFEEFYKLIS